MIHLRNAGARRAYHSIFIQGKRRTPPLPNLASTQTLTATTQACTKSRKNYRLRLLHFYEREHALLCGSPTMAPIRREVTRTFNQ